MESMGMSIEITFNGSAVVLAAGATMADLLSSRGLQASQVVIEYNGEVLPVRVAADPLVLSAGDVVNCFRVVAGG